MKTQVFLVCLAALFLQASAFAKRDANEDVGEKVTAALASLATATQEEFQKLVNSSRIEEGFKEIQQKMAEVTDPNVKKAVTDAQEKIKEFISSNVNKESVDKISNNLSNAMKSINDVAKEIAPKIEDAGSSVGKSVVDMMTQISNQIKEAASKLQSQN